MRGPLSFNQNTFGTEQYARDAAFLDWQFREQAKYGGSYGGLPNRLIKNYYFHTPAQISDQVMPANNVVLSADPIAQAQGWQAQLFRDGYVRGDQRFIRQQGTVTTGRARAIGQSFTRELRHPDTGEQTNFVNLSHMPAYPTKTQVDYGLARAEMAGAQRRNVDNDLYWRAANQSFRHQERR